MKTKAPTVPTSPDWPPDTIAAAIAPPIHSASLKARDFTTAFATAAFATLLYESEHDE